eukprot:756786-Hanusia_phi.AAC.3
MRQSAMVVIGMCERNDQGCPELLCDTQTDAAGIVAVPLKGLTDSKRERHLLVDVEELAEAKQIGLGHSHHLLSGLQHPCSFN